MAEIKEIIKIIEKIAPLDTQEDWDNSGWQTRLNKKDIKRVLLCVSVTEDILNQAKSKNCDMIISHHPIYFKGGEDKELLREIIRDHFPIYSIHTPFDKANGGTTDSLIEACGFYTDEILNEYTKIFYADLLLKELVERIKKGLKVKNLRITNYEPKKIIKKAAFCAGSGTSFCEEVEKANCDCFITADLKYHTALDFKGTIIDLGHFESEKPALNTIKEALKDIAECEIANEKSPIEII